MSIEAILQDQNQSLDQWAAALPNYTQNQLNQSPSPEAWSLGQVYIHILNAGIYYFPHQIKACLQDPDQGQEGQLSDFGQKAFQHNSFPPIDIKLPGGGPPPPAPKSIEELHQKIDQLRQVSADIAQQLQNHPPSGKIKHFGFGYLDAQQWFQVNAMHLRHHLRQKAKLDQFLQGK